MNKKQKEIVATLMQAGRNDLAAHIIAAGTFGKADLKKEAQVLVQKLKAAGVKVSKDDMEFNSNMMYGGKGTFTVELAVDVNRGGQQGWHTSYEYIRLQESYEQSGTWEYTLTDRNGNAKEWADSAQEMAKVVKKKLDKEKSKPGLYQPAGKGDPGESYRG